MYVRTCLSILAIAVAGCSTQPITSSGQAARAEAQITEVWEYPASAFPTICMIFKSDGTLQFRGGFLFFNGGSWKRDRESSITSIVLGGSAPFQMDAVKEQGNGKTAAPTAYDPATRTIRYRIGPSTESLQFAGFVFYRKAECSAA